MSVFGMAGLSYSDVMQVLGRYIEDKKLKDVCLLEIEGGVVIQGIAVATTYEGYTTLLQTYTLNREEISRLMKGVRR